MTNWRTKRVTEANNLLAEGVLLCQYGERAPGGDETWVKWAAKAEDWLRRNCCEQFGHDGGCPDCRTTAQEPTCDQP